MANYLNNNLTNIGSYSNDPYFSFARDTLQQLTKDLCNNTMYNQSLPTGNTDFLLSQLNAWENSCQNLQQQMSNVQTEQQHLLNTVFKFEPDHFKMLVDVRGYQPTEIKLTVTTAGLEITANREQTLKGPTGCGYANRTITKSYEMPLHVLPDQVVCNLTPEGTLYITAPWIKNC